MSCVTTTVGPSEQELVREAVVRYALEEWEEPYQPEIVCLAIENSGTDPSGLLLDKLSSLKPSIRANSTCHRGAYATVLETNSNRQGILLIIKTARSIWHEEATIDASYYIANESAGGLRYSLTKKSGSWVVISVKKLWIA